MLLKGYKILKIDVHMKNLFKNKKFVITAILVLVFLVYTALVKFVDVRPAGPYGFRVGLASINDVFVLSEPNEILYKITDYASLLAIPVGITFTAIGVVQLIKRKSIFKVDSNIVALGVLYVFTGLAYLLFELLKVNVRPFPLDGKIEASYPSSTTVLALTIFVTAADQISLYVKNKNVERWLIAFDIEFTLFLIGGRIISGVHWMTDIVGGLILGGALIQFYYWLKGHIKEQVEKREKHPEEIAK